MANREIVRCLTCGQILEFVAGQWVSDEGRGCEQFDRDHRPDSEPLVEETLTESQPGPRIIL